ncbi:MAG: hypothetical protein A3A86_04385 [Elusimicrobia bacterium RIFCSPLOWO2_01_FULL_60_11]|nr:MAG: hypothetical protein A3A86_04385 [Elusimicrobia bacterium RIFCSPLOWO2_01_FULL_60_11]
MAKLAIRIYEGPIHLVSSSHDLALAVQVIRGEKVVGLDTETRPAFRKGESYLPCLVQIAVASGAYLFQLKRMDFSRALTEILENPSLIKAGIGLADDIKSLKKVFPFQPQNLLDLSLAAQSQGFEQSSVRSLAAQLLGFRVSKSTSTSNWAANQLTPKQIAYAATDAWVCRELFLRFKELGLLDPEGRPKKRPLHLVAKDYVDILERIERTKDPQKLQKLEEKRAAIHWNFMESLKEQGIEFGDRFDTAKKAFELVQKAKVQ